MEDGEAAEGCVDPVLLLEVRENLIGYATLDPPKKLMGIGDGIVEADVKGKMPAILTDANDRKLNGLIPILAEPGMSYHFYSAVGASTKETVTHFKQNKSYSTESRRGRLRVTLLTRGVRLVNVCGRHSRGGASAIGVVTAANAVIGQRRVGHVHEKCQSAGDDVWRHIPSRSFSALDKSKQEARPSKTNTNLP